MEKLNKLNINFFENIYIPHNIKFVQIKPIKISRYDKNGFDNSGIHKDTGTEYNKNGLNRGGYTQKEMYQMRKK
ncbi:MAG: hypothetical protein DRG78_12065 [Epsilonproteobacteria bacterium]|nr:MAG: hypothetical protein DRG78_12065 [Campylobacterota bacterium]